MASVEAHTNVRLTHKIVKSFFRAEYSFDSGRVLIGMRRGDLTCLGMLSIPIPVSICMPNANDILVLYLYPTSTV